MGEMSRTSLNKSSKARSIAIPGMGLLALLFLAGRVALPSPLSAQTPVPDVNQLMDYIDDLYRAQSSYSSMRMTVAAVATSPAMIDSARCGETFRLSRVARLSSSTLASTVS